MMRYNRHLLFWFLLLACMFILTGCWDRRELEERTSFLAIAIDTAKDNPELYKITVQIPIPIKISGSGGSGGGKAGESVRIMSSTGKTILDAANNMQKRLNQRIFLGHARVVAISEEIAREGLRDITDGFRRDPQMRRLLWPIVVKGEASELLRIQPKLAQIPIVYVMDMLESGTRTQIMPDQTLGNFYIRTSSSHMQPYLNYVEVANNEVIWKGTAVFQEDKMVGILPDIQTWVLMQLTENEHGGDILVPIKGTKDKFLTVHPKLVTTKIKAVNDPNARGGHRVTYLCKVQGDVVETTFQPSFKDEDNIEIYQKIVKEELEQRAKKLLTLLQKQYKTDVLNLGSVMRAHHYRDFWVMHNWKEDFPKMPISVEYDVRIRRLGMEMQ